MVLLLPPRRWILAALLSLANAAIALAAGKPVEYIDILAKQRNVPATEGIVITGTDVLATPDKFRPPVEISVVAKTDTLNLRLGYAADYLIFNWERKPSELRVDGGPAAGKHKAGAGEIPADKYVTIKWVVTATKQEVYVDGQLRYEHAGDYSQIEKPVSVFTRGNAHVTLKSLTVTSGASAPIAAAATASPITPVPRPPVSAVSATPTPAAATGSLPTVGDLKELEITAQSKLLEKDTKTINNVKETVEQWAYDVGVTNKTAKDFANVQVKYVIFVKDEKEASGGTDARTVRTPGSTTLASIKGRLRADFQTTKVNLVKTQLQGGYIYTNRGRPRSSDSLSGIWIRIYDGGKMISEFSNPPALATKEKWEGK